MNRHRSFSPPITMTRTVLASQFLVFISNSSTVFESHTHGIFCTNVNSSMFEYFREILIIIPHLISSVISHALSVSFPTTQPRLFISSVAPFCQTASNPNAHLRKLQILHNLYISIQRRSPHLVPLLIPRVRESTIIIIVYSPLAHNYSIYVLSTTDRSSSHLVVLPRAGFYK